MAEYLWENEFVQKNEFMYEKLRHSANKFSLARKLIRFSKHHSLFNRLKNHIKEILKRLKELKNKNNLT